MAEAEAQAAAGAEGRALVRYEAEEGVAVLTLDDPPANTYTYEMMRQLDEAILRARMDDSVHVIVITGAGEKFFCAGANIAMLTEMTPTFKYYFCLHANETLSRLEQTPKLVVAAINGHCVGGGVGGGVGAPRRPPRRVQRRGQDGAARGELRRPAGNGRDATARARRRQVAGNRVDGRRATVRLRARRGTRSRQSRLRGRLGRVVWRAGHGLRAPLHRAGPRRARRRPHQRQRPVRHRSPLRVRPRP